MYLAVVENVNGATTIKGEFTDNEQGAMVMYGNRFSALWNAEDVATANLSILDEALNTYGGYHTFISHPQVEGYLDSDKFYEDEEHTQEIEGKEGTCYIDIPSNKKYKFNGSKYVAL